LADGGALKGAPPFLRLPLSDLAMKVRFVLGALMALAIACVRREPNVDIDLSPGAADSGAVVQRLADGVYAVIRKEPQGVINESNSLFIIGERDVIVVDAQSSFGRTRETLAALRRLTNKPVSTVVNTHWHDDHVVGNAVYRDSFPGVEFIGHAANAEDMATLGVQFRTGGVRSRLGTIDFLRNGLVGRKQSFLGGPIDAEESRSHLLSAWLLTEYSNADSTLRPLTPTRPVIDRLVLRQGSREIEILFLGRGHTRGDLVVHLPREGVVAAGDLLMWPVPFAGSTSFPREQAATLERLRALRPRLVVPGHGPVLDRARADAHAGLVGRMLVSLDDQVRASVARGDSVSQTVRTVDLKAYADSIAGTSSIRRVLFEYYIKGEGVRRAWALAKRDSTRR
jgi:glyoxylase-like metal-dependent hydrolase (beta-lactamase superfamily II)